MLKYSAAFLNLCTAGNFFQVEKIQSTFLNLVGFILHLAPHDYRKILKALKIEPLAKRSHSLGLIFLNGVLSGKVDFS